MTNPETRTASPLTRPATQPPPWAPIEVFEAIYFAKLNNNVLLWHYRDV